MKTSNVVPVDLGNRSYKIHIQPGLIKNLSSCLGKAEHIVVVTDANVEKLYLAEVMKLVNEIADRADSVVVPAGETSKTIAQCDHLWQTLVSLNADRKSVVVALGGGVVGDLAGFIAASFARGLDFIQIPTTLLAQVDSSVGGKVGVNLPTAKNMVGAFWQPQVVAIDPEVLGTLDDRNYTAGMAEVIKYGVIMDLPLFEFLEKKVDAINNRNAAVLTEIIAWCCRCKAQVVEEDETETSGRRAILNYGHTFGHAIESVLGYGKYLHGEAIAIGMGSAAALAIKIGMCAPDLLQRQTKLFAAVGLPTRLPADLLNKNLDDLIAAMKRDKKVAAGSLNLILPTCIGEVKQVPAPDDALLRDAFSNEI